ncbi:hypothetical protein G6F50_014329 [Rhizopus delemar]|uniref:Uncharacterized protein n=1 Tax=Rhizopus delemar TaxID=936053 RepID=A0A9P6Y6J8_9FUNG|nr:hypothetical protein G6F50_014329 [Rhizopus delemar]
MHREPLDTIIGEGNGIWAQYDFTPVAGDAVTVDIDASRVEGRAGSGIYIEEKFDPANAAVVARFNFRNGAELVGGDGNLLRVDATDANIALNVDNSRMTGNVVNAGGSTVNVALSNGAVLNGAMTNSAPSTSATALSPSATARPSTPSTWPATSPATAAPSPSTPYWPAMTRPPTS